MSSRTNNAFSLGLDVITLSQLQDIQSISSDLLDHKKIQSRTLTTRQAIRFYYDHINLAKLGNNQSRLVNQAKGIQLLLNLDAFTASVKRINYENKLSLCSFNDVAVSQANIPKDELLKFADGIPEKFWPILFQQDSLVDIHVKPSNCIKGLLTMSDNFPIKVGAYWRSEVFLNTWTEALVPLLFFCLTFALPNF